MQKEYEFFWQELSKFYPISKGELRLPIATEIIDLKKYISKKDLEGVRKYLQKNISSINSKDIKERLTTSGDTHLLKHKIEKFSGFIRLDCMVDSRTKAFKIIEINSDNPDGLLLHDHTFSTTSKKLSSVHHDIFSKSVPKKSEYIFVLYPEDAFFLDSYYCEYLFLQGLGYECGIGTHKDLKHKGDYFFHNDKKVTTIRRCTEIYKLPKDFLQKTKSKFINTLHMRVLGYKNFLVGKEKFLLKTHKLEQKNLEFLIKNKNYLVLKPTNLSEGKGIYLGVNTKQKEWNRLLQENLVSGNYFLQEYLSPSKMSIKYYDGGTVKKGNFYFDICPHFYVEKNVVKYTGHILVRFSKEKILNVTRGGAIGYGVL
jgi:hypothetical protein